MRQTSFTHITPYLTSASRKQVESKSNKPTSRNVLHTPTLPNFRHQQMAGLQTHISFVQPPSERASRDNVHYTTHSFVRNTISMASFSLFLCHFSRQDAYLQRGRARRISIFVTLQQSPSNLYHINTPKHQQPTHPTKNNNSKTTRLSASCRGNFLKNTNCDNNST